MRLIKDIKDKNTGQLVYPKTHIKAVAIDSVTNLADFIGTNVGDRLNKLESVIITNGDGNYYLTDDGSYKDLGEYQKIANANLKFETIENVSGINNRLGVVENTYIDKTTAATKTELMLKQDIIEDLEQIRLGARLGITSVQNISHLAVKEEVDAQLLKKVDIIEGKQLSEEDFTSELKAKLESLNNYNDSALSESISELSARIDTLVNADSTVAINTFNEIIKFLEGIENTEDLEGIIASIQQQINKVNSDLSAEMSNTYLSKEEALATYQPIGNYLTSIPEEYITEEELTPLMDAKQNLIVDLVSIREGAALGKTSLQVIPSEYITESELEAKDYANNTDLNVGLNSKQNLISDLSEIREGAALGATALQRIPEGYITEGTLNAKGYATIEELTNGLATKQEVINDLQTIRENAALGATAIQAIPSEYITETELEAKSYATTDDVERGLNTKQNLITDITDIREGAALGATALQSIPSEYITESELIAKDYATVESVTNGLATKQNIISDLQTIREGAALGATAIQQHQSLAHLATTTELQELSNRIDATYVTSQAFTTKTSTIEGNVSTLSTTVDNMQDLNVVLMTADSTTSTRVVKDLYDKTSSSRVYPKTHSDAVIVDSSTLSDYVTSNTQRVQSLENIVKTDGNGTLYLSNNGTYKDLELNKYLTITNAQNTYATITSLSNYTTNDDLSALETIVTGIKNSYVTKSEKTEITEEIELVKANYVTISGLSETLSSYVTTTNLTEGLNTKVDKVSGKGLSTNDFTTEFKSKLEGLSNYDDTAVKNSISTLSSNVADAIAYTSYVQGVNTVTSLTNIPVDKRLVIASISGNGSLTLKTTPSVGREVHVIIKNNSSSDIAVTLPNSGNYVNTLDSVMTVGANSYGEINFISDGNIIYIKYI